MYQPKYYFHIDISEFNNFIAYRYYHQDHCLTLLCIDEFPLDNGFPLGQLHIWGHNK